MTRLYSFHAWASALVSKKGVQIRGIYTVSLATLWVFHPMYVGTSCCSLTKWCCRQLVKLFNYVKENLHYYVQYDEKVEYNCTKEIIICYNNKTQHYMYNLSFTYIYLNMCRLYIGLYIGPVLNMKK